MKREDLGVFLSVISHKRPANIEKMQSLIGAATWFVGQGESASYQRASAVVEGGGLCQSRNSALKAAFNLGLPCLQISDDAKNFSKVKMTADGKKTKEAIILLDAVQEMKIGIKTCKSFLAGVAPTSNPFFSNDRFKNRHFIVGDFILVMPCNIFFDEALRLKEDYDYTLQHISQKRAVARCDHILADFAHRTNPGGAVAFRNATREQQAISYLAGKWPGKITPNAKRPNEILLRLK